MPENEKKAEPNESIVLVFEAVKISTIGHQSWSVGISSKNDIKVIKKEDILIWRSFWDHTENRAETISLVCKLKNNCRECFLFIIFLSATDHLSRTRRSYFDTALVLFCLIQQFDFVFFFWNNVHPKPPIRCPVATIVLETQTFSHAVFSVQFRSISTCSLHEREMQCDAFYTKANGCSSGTVRV